MSFAFFALVIDIAAILCAGLIGARILAVNPRATNARLVAIIAACNICHIVLGRHDYGMWIPQALRIDVGTAYPLFNLARNLTPGLFMLLAWRLFTDRPGLPRTWLVLFLIQAALEEPGHVLLSMDLPYSLFVAEIVPGLLQVAFVTAAIYWALADWRVDLVESRRRMRAFTVVFVGLNALATSLMLRVVIPQNTPANYYGHVLFLSINLVILLFLLFGIFDGRLAAYAGVEAAKPLPTSDLRDAGDDAALVRLIALMEGGRVHNQPGLTLKDVADQVDLPEYRLRRLIHERLGYRNFNAFLHDYRVRDACAQLRDPAMSRTPILTIALSVGYDSVNTFNRGFREVMGTTPSAYRAAGKK